MINSTREWDWMDDRIFDLEFVGEQAPEVGGAFPSPNEVATRKFNKSLIKE